MEYIDKENIMIGKQIWQNSNLTVDKFKNGDSIPQVLNDEDWEQRIKDGKPAWCYYNNNPENNLKAGKLYNWWAVNDSRGLAPEGFHVPSNNEWRELVEYLGGMDVAGTKMKSTSGWKKEGNGDNSSGFNAVPAGKRYLQGGFDTFFNDNCHWWSSTESNPYMAWYWNLYFLDGKVIMNQAYKDAGMTVRCIKD